MEVAKLEEEDRLVFHTQRQYRKSIDNLVRREEPDRTPDVWLVVAPCRQIDKSLSSGPSEERN